MMKIGQICNLQDNFLSFKLAKLTDSNCSSKSFNKRPKLILATCTNGNQAVLQQLSQKSGNNGRNSGRAVVMGGSLCGLVTSKMLAKHFDEVVILESDESTNSEMHTNANQLPADVATINRRGVPHYTQPHTLSSGGYKILDEVFNEESVTRELQQLGATTIDYTQQVRTINGSIANTKPKGDSSIIGLGCSRHLLETMLRNRINNVQNISFVSGVKVQNFIIDATNNSIQGVVVNNDEFDFKIEAELVVDGSGRGSKTGDWLAQGGLVPPPVTKVDAHLRYGCRIYQLSKPLPYNNQMIIQIPNRHSQKKHIGIIVPIERNRIQLVMSGYNYEGPPRDESGYLQYINELDSMDIYDEISVAKPLTPVIPFGNTANTIKSYHKINMPLGLAVIGDAGICLNPVKGMGMGKLMQEVQAFDRSLKSCSRNGCLDLNRLSDNLQNEIYKSARFSLWQCGIGDSFFKFASIQGAENGILENSLLERYYWAVLSQVPTDGVIGYAALRVMQNLDNPTTLCHPKIVSRVAWNLILEFIASKKNEFSQFQQNLFSTVEVSS